MEAFCHAESSAVWARCRAIMAINFETKPWVPQDQARIGQICWCVLLWSSRARRWCWPVSRLGWRALQVGGKEPQSWPAKSSAAAENWAAGAVKRGGGLRFLSRKWMRMSLSVPSTAAAVLIPHDCLRRPNQGGVWR
jgi:hypothetical protein